MFALRAPAVPQRNVTVAASQPKFKGALKARKLRPIKYNQSDKRHGPAKYEPLPTPPAEYKVTAKPADKQ
ncbi:hypothetical protein HYH03_010003 [Edaphochlamys debaryana]|uniref:Uncharacterized protein n=1 Tax=Edaphochlamys debaryana TaxID=47281 RepID=A0A835XXV8_9CHLO|nr:hypothetical protein HYH03_010003 [Edaphochlamys debaryana]|eukprot:KAG2491632.1 hypothetical protein HYH03_010003 [Edaphochlamys debaryana]